MKHLVSWSIGRNFNAWHVIARWFPRGAVQPADPITICGITVATSQRCFREAVIRPAEVCEKCWPAAQQAKEVA